MEGRRMRSGWGRVGLAALGCLLVACGRGGGEGREALSEGRRELRMGAYRDALEHFRVAVAKDPSSVPALTERGETAEFLGEFDEALEAFEAAARLKPSAARFYRVGALADRMGHTPEAVEWLKATLAAAPARRSEPWIDVLQGLLVRFRVSREDVAERLFRVHVDAGDSAAALDLARNEKWIIEGANYCEEPLEKVSEETQELLAVLVHPQSAECLYSLGEDLTNKHFARLGRRVMMEAVRHAKGPEARERAEAFLRARLPAHEVARAAEALNAVGNTLGFRYSKTDDGLAAFEKAIAADPAFSWPYSNVANLMVRRGKRELGIEWYRKAIAVNPNHWRAHLGLGSALMRAKRYDEALTELRAAVALLPGDAESHSNLGRVLLNLYKEQDGIRELQIAVRLNPENREDQRLLNSRLQASTQKAPPPAKTR